VDYFQDFEMYRDLNRVHYHRNGIQSGEGGSIDAYWNDVTSTTDQLMGQENTDYGTWQTLNNNGLAELQRSFRVSLKYSYIDKDGVLSNHALDQTVPLSTTFNADPIIDQCPVTVLEGSDAYDGIGPPYYKNTSKACTFVRHNVLLTQGQVSW
jgi:hypothetical protein